MLDFYLNSQFEHEQNFSSRLYNWVTPLSTNRAVLSTPKPTAEPAYVAFPQTLPSPVVSPPSLPKIRRHCAWRIFPLTMQGMAAPPPPCVPSVLRENVPTVFYFLFSWLCGCRRQQGCLATGRGSNLCVFFRDMVCRERPGPALPSLANLPPPSQPPSPPPSSRPSHPLLRGEWGDLCTGRERTCRRSVCCSDAFSGNPNDISTLLLHL